MKQYVLSQEDVDRLLAYVDRDPRHGPDGGSSLALSNLEEEARDRAHRFYNYQVRKWLDEVTK